MALNIRQPFHPRELTPLPLIVFNDITRNETGFCVLPPNTYCRWSYDAKSQTLTTIVEVFP